MILFIIMLKAQKTILAKQHEGCQRERQREREYLSIMVEMLNRT